MIQDVNDSIPLIAYIGVIPAMLGLGIGALAIWTEHKRKVATLEVLKVYAEKGEEPPEAVLASLNLVVSNKAPDDGTSETGWRKFAFFLVMSLGFGGLFLSMRSWSAEAWLLVLGFGVTAFVMAAVAASKLVQALTGPKKNAR